MSGQIQVGAALDLMSLGQATKVSGVLKAGGMDAVRMLGRVGAVELGTNVGSYAALRAGEEMNLPEPLTLLLGLSAGAAVNYQLGKRLLRSGTGSLSNVGVERIAQAEDLPVINRIDYQDVFDARNVGNALENGRIIKGYFSFADLMSPEDAIKYNNWVDLREAGLDQAKINDIILTNKGYRPDPATYLSQEYIDAHLELFSDGVVKISATTPIGHAGPPGGTFVMPKSVANDIIREANGDISKLEQLLSLEPGTLGDSPVRLDIAEPQGLRMPSGNELGANEQWIPGGSTRGGIPEATIDPPQQGEFVSTPIFE